MKIDVRGTFIAKAAGRYIEGTLSGLALDADGDDMSGACLSDLVDQINRQRVPVTDEHRRRSVFGNVGDAVKAWLDGSEIKIRALVNGANRNAVELHERLKRETLNLGLSLAGRVQSVERTRTGNRYGKILLDHVAVTTKPSFKPSLGSLVAKGDRFDPWTEEPLVLVRKSLSYPGEMFRQPAQPKTVAGWARSLEGGQPVGHFGVPEEPKQQETFLNLIRRGHRR